MNKQICILDYDCGNTKSLINVFKKLSIKCILTNEKEKIKESSHFILPGVGSFKTAVEKFKNYVPEELLKTEIFEKKKPILGICVGMQIMATEGNEFKKTMGLNWIEGKVEKMKNKKFPLPHVGWNNVTQKVKSNLFKNIETDTDFYFLNSFAFNTKRNDDILAISIYENKFISAIRKNNIFGLQFHPEKSQKAGRKLLSNFVEYY